MRDSICAFSPSSAAAEDVGIAGADILHLLGRYRAVVQRRAPVRSALEHRQVLRRLGDLLDRLHAGRTGADHRDPFALETDRLLRPQARVIGLAAEAVATLDPREGRCREGADGGDHEPAGVPAAVLQGDRPGPAGLVINRRGDPGAKLDVAAQVELVRDVVQVLLGLRLRPVLGKWSD